MMVRKTQFWRTRKVIFKMRKNRMSIVCDFSFYKTYTFFLLFIFMFFSFFFNFLFLRCFTKFFGILLFFLHFIPFKHSFVLSLFIILLYLILLFLLLSFLLLPLFFITCSFSSYATPLTITYCHLKLCKPTWIIHKMQQETFKTTTDCSQKRKGTHLTHR